MRLLKGVRRLFRWSLRLLLLLLLADLVYLAFIWPDWDSMKKGSIPKTQFIAAYEAQRAERHWPRVQWHPVPLSAVPRHLMRAVIIGEDARFYTHSGFDLAAIREAVDYNLAEGRIVVGASTISQQTAKNLFLSPARNPLRKWHEMVLTWGLEQNLSKRRILEIYLNTAEFGRGIYGVEAAARAYWGVSARQLSVLQAAELAATLPGPTKHNPATRTAFFMKRVQKINARLSQEFAPRDGFDADFPGLQAI